MAKKYIRIPSKDLPNLIYFKDDNNPSNNRNSYFLRYRIASEDGGITSRWSQIFEIKTLVNSDNLSEKVIPDIKWNSGILSVTWNVNTLLEEKIIFDTKFDVYVRFYDHTTPLVGDWFRQQVSSTNFSTTIPAGADRADIAVFVPTYVQLNQNNQLSQETPPTAIIPDSLLFSATNVH